MENTGPLTELAYLAEALKGKDASQGDGELVFALPPEAAGATGKGRIEFPNTTNPEELKVWATTRASEEQLSKLIAEAQAAAAALEGDRSGIAQRLIVVLEAHIREGMGAPVDLAVTHREVFGFDLAPIDPSHAIAAHREFLAQHVDAPADEPIFHAALRLQTKFEKFTNIKEVEPSVEETLKRCVAAADNLIDSMNFSANKTDTIKAKIRGIRAELQSEIPYAGKASLQGETVKIVLRPQAEIASQQLTVIHEFTHALQIILRQMGFEEGSLHFEDLVSVAGSGAVALDEGLADRHSHNLLQGYLHNQTLLKPRDDIAAQHWVASFGRRQMVRTSMSAAIQNGAKPKALERLILEQGFSPAAANMYLATARAETQTTNALYVPSYYHGGQLFLARWAQDPQRTVREFLHMEGSDDYRSLSSK